MADKNDITRRSFIAGLGAALATALGLGRVAKEQGNEPPTIGVGRGSPLLWPPLADNNPFALPDPITIRTLYSGEWDINGGKMRRVQIIQFGNAEYFMYIDGELVPDAIIEVDGPGDMFIYVRGYA